MTRAVVLTLTSEPIRVTSGWPLAAKFARMRGIVRKLRPILHRIRTKPYGEISYLSASCRHAVECVSFPANHNKNSIGVEDSVPLWSRKCLAAGGLDRMPGW
jgi:hypothetical protein